MLLLLHLTAMRGVEDVWARALMVAHFGLFILWQPFMRGEQTLTPLQVAVVALVCVLALSYWNWWLMLLLAGILLLLGLTWNPRAGFAGLAMLFSRYLLSVGLPFEKWVYFLAELSRSESQPEKFLRLACGGLDKLPWVSGGEWRSSVYSGKFGQPSKNTVEYADKELQLRAYTHYNPSPALIWHFHLLG